jgi:hypothetical protein
VTTPAAITASPRRYRRKPAPPSPQPRAAITASPRCHHCKPAPLLPQARAAATASASSAPSAALRLLTGKHQIKSL